MRKKFFHEKILELKKLKEAFNSLKYKGIGLWPNVMENVYVLQSKESLSSSRALRVLKFLFFMERFRIPREKGKILVNFPLDRKDHHELFKKFISSFKEDEVSIIDAFQSGERNLKSIAKRFAFSFPNIFKIIKIHLHLSKHKTQDIIGSKKNYFYLLFFTYYVFKKIDYWHAVYDRLQPKAFLGYASYRNNEDITMTQICKKYRKKTFTTQHYAFFDFPEFNSESITYENMISDCILLWGKASYEVMDKFIPEDRLLIAGNPLYTNIKRTNKKFKPEICVIFLDYPQYAKSNYEIIKIMSKFAEKNQEIKFYIKNHPVNEPKEYEKLVANTKLILLPRYADKEEWMKKADFIVVHNTTIALEALQYQIPIFRFKDKTCFDMAIPEYYFTNFKEFDNIFYKFKAKKDYSKEYYDAYLNNFYQPNGISVQDYYKKLIKTRVNQNA